MKSFKLERGGSLKKQALSAGCLLAILGIVCGLLVDMLVGYVLVLVGLVLVIAAFAAEN